MDEIVGQGEQVARMFVAAMGSGDPVRWAAMFTDDATYAVPDFPNPFGAGTRSRRWQPPSSRRSPTWHSRSGQ